MEEVEIENVTLMSNEGDSFTVDVRVAKMSETVKNLVEDAGTDNPVPLPNVSSKVLAKVIEYCKYHFEHPTVVSDEGGSNDNNSSSSKRTDDIIGWDLEFCKVDQPTLFELILAANYLDIKELLDLTCKTVANMIKGKTPEEIRKTFNIKNDFTPEEEAQIAKENEWCEER